MTSTKNVYSVLGLMSGTSLDGLDIAHCIFKQNNNQWSFELNQCTTIPYSTKTKDELKNAILLSGEKLIQTHIYLGEFMGKECLKFINKHQLKIDLIASHGHTVFHQPSKRITYQIGNGASISSITNKTTVCDFRSLDVALGGQGAPLVPIGDELLFPSYDYCLNLGGFANVSYKKNNQRIAFDICAINMTLNFLAKKEGFEYDKNGNLAKTGEIIPQLLNQLNSIDFYSLNPPKSLGKEWHDSTILPLIKNKYKTTDVIRTYVEHCAIQIAKVLQKNNSKTLLTGGGAHNTYLVERIKHYSSSEIILPNKKIIDYKEALIFGLLGVLRIKNQVNCLKSVTGAEKNSIGGAVYQY